MPVILLIWAAWSSRFPSCAQSSVKTSRHRGAKSSCSVQPRVYHRDLARESLALLTSLADGTSARCAKQISASSYHRNIELIASASSVLFVLSIQHVSTQTYWIPLRRASLQVPAIFW